MKINKSRCDLRAKVLPSEDVFSGIEGFEDPQQVPATRIPES